MAKRIQNPGVGQLLQGLFDLQGRVQPQLDEIIVPTVQLGDLGRGSAPPVVRAVSHQCVMLAVAGEFAGARLEVPGNTLLKITAIHVSPTTSGFAYWKFTNASAALAGTADKEVTDGRLSDQNVGAGSVMTFGTRVGGLANPAALVKVNSTGTTFTPEHWVIGSGRPDQFGFWEFGFQSPNVQVVLTVEGLEYTIA